MTLTRMSHWAWLSREWRAHRWRTAVSVFSVGAAVAAMLFFGALGAGLRHFTSDIVSAKTDATLLEVVPRSMELGLFRMNRPGLMGATGLDEQSLERLRHVQGVSAVFPKRIVRVPLGAQGGAGLLGKDMYTDVLAEGEDSALLRRSVDASRMTWKPGDPIPVIVSDQLLALYNGSVADAIRMPKLAPEAVIGLSFNLVIGKSYLLGTAGARKVETLRAQIVGVSPHAMRIGMTLPLEVADWIEREFKSEQEPPLYTSAWVQLARIEDGPEVSRAVEKLGFKIADTDRRAADAVALAQLALAAIAGLVLILAAVSIGHTFTAQLIERRGEFALLRAMGATPIFVVTLVAREALVVGVLGGLCGLAGGAAIVRFADRALTSWVSDVPLHPDHFFLLPPLLLLAAVALAIAASLLGAAVPLGRLLGDSPARALSAVED